LRSGNRSDNSGPGRFSAKGDDRGDPVDMADSGPTEDEVEAAEDSWANFCAPSDIVEPAVDVVKVLNELFPDVVVVITGSIGAPEYRSGPSLATGRTLVAAVSPPLDEGC